MEVRSKRSKKCVLKKGEHHALCVEILHSGKTISHHPDSVLPSLNSHGISTYLRREHEAVEAPSDDHDAFPWIELHFVEIPEFSQDCPYQPHK